MGANPLEIKLFGKTLKNPIIAASGTFGFGDCFNASFDPHVLGGICSKGLTLYGSSGNGGTRLQETPSGLLNSIGLENPGIESFVAHEYAIMRQCNDFVVVNLGGHCESDYVEGAKLLNDVDIDALELNISCPNVKNGGMAYGISPNDAAYITKAITKVSRHPLIVKLSPNAPDVSAVAAACQDSGADAVSLVNTYLGMAVDIYKRKPVFERIYAGLSGPAIMPMALRLVHETAKRVSIPVIGLGGISSFEDAVAFMMVGADAVQIGTAIFADPTSIPKIIDDLNNFCASQGLKNISEIKGII